MENILYILAPKDAKINVRSNRVYVNDVPIELKTEAEEIRFLRKSSGWFGLGVYYVYKEDDFSKKESSSVLICSRDDIIPGEDEANYFALNSANNLRSMIMSPTGKDYVNFFLGDSPATFNVRLGLFQQPAIA